jgi:hypothetical protein
MQNTIEILKKEKERLKFEIAYRLRGGVEDFLEFREHICIPEMERAINLMYNVKEIDRAIFLLEQSLGDE